MPDDQRVQKLPATPNVTRVETGAVQFGDDWPGLFIRGDSAYMLMVTIRQLARRLAGHPDAEVGDLVSELVSYADLIDVDVIVR